MRCFGSEWLASATSVMLLVFGCGQSEGGGGSTGGAGQAMSEAGSGTAGSSVGGAGASSAGKGPGGSAGTPAAGNQSGGNSGSGGNEAGAGSDVGGAGLVDCDPKKILCKRLAPECGAGEVPSVDGSCYGECVKIARCACDDAAQCPEPNQYTCWSSSHCGPFVE